MARAGSHLGGAPLGHLSELQSIIRHLADAITEGRPSQSQHHPNQTEAITAAGDLLPGAVHGRPSLFFGF